MVVCNEITKEDIACAERILEKRGFSNDDAKEVLQEIAYRLMCVNLYPKAPDMPPHLYGVSIAVDGRATLAIHAETPEEAKEKAEVAFGDYDLRNLEVVGWHVVNAEDENGNLTDFV